MPEYRKLQPPEPGSDKEKFLEWWVVPEALREPKTIQQFAQTVSVTRETLHIWKKEPGFRRELEKRMDDFNMSPDRVQEVINSVYRSAKAGDMKAAALYLQHVDKLAPKKVVIEDRSIAGMSDAELQQELQQLVASSE